MEQKQLKLIWPNGTIKKVNAGDSWMKAADQCGIKIPTGCLRGSCGACEIEVDGEIIRACISKISPTKGGVLEVHFLSDDIW